MRTIKEHYSKNIAILKENLKRGLSEKQADQVIASFEKQFIDNNLYNEEEKQFIDEMKQAVDKHFYKEITLSEMCENMGISFQQFN